jgi:hypothetical protein
MANNDLVFEVGAVYLYVTPDFPADILICTSKDVLAGAYQEINTSWEFNPDEGGSYDAKYLRKLAPSVQALVEQVAPFGFGV